MSSIKVPSIFAVCGNFKCNIITKVLHSVDAEAALVWAEIGCRNVNKMYLRKGNFYSCGRTSEMVLEGKIMDLVYKVWRNVNYAKNMLFERYSFKNYNNVTVEKFILINRNSYLAVIVEKFILMNRNRTSFLWLWRNLYW